MERSRNGVFDKKIEEKRVVKSISKREQKELFDKRENNFFHWVKVSFIIAFGVCVIAISAVLVWHMLAPHSWRWLGREEVSSLERLFVTGIGAGLLGKFGSKLAE